MDRIKTWLRGGVGVCLLASFVVFGGACHAGGSEYLVGIFGVPTGDWNVLREVGLNAVLVREDEIDMVRNSPLRKIYVLGVNPPQMKKGLDLAAIESRMKRFRGLKDAYSYYVAGDLNCGRKPMVEALKRRLNLNERAMVGLAGKGKGIDCFPDYDVVFYHYPLMRRQLSLAEMLAQQVATLKRDAFRARLFVQSHQQAWYREAIRAAGNEQSAYLYPDGQVVRMLVYYAVATGCKGYFLYDHEAMSGENARERILGAAQAIQETRPLYPLIVSATETEYFQRRQEVYGTIVRSPRRDLFFVFSGDATTNYHPTTRPLNVPLQEVLGAQKYQSVHQYSPLGCTPAGEKVKVTQDRALILIGSKDKESLDALKLDAGSLRTYEKLLEARVERLVRNLKSRGLVLPELKQTGTASEARVTYLLELLDQLNEMKREAWWKRAGKLPLDGDVLNDIQWGRTLQQAKPSKDDLFNFYFH